MSIRHRIAHLFGLNLGGVVSWWQDEGDKYVAYIGFQCATCGEITGESVTGYRERKDARIEAFGYCVKRR